MSESKTLAEAARDVIDDIRARGWSEAMGLEEVPLSRVIDPLKCKCGAGCESVLECEFWYWVRKTDAMERRAHRQVQFGRHRVDSLFDCDGKRVVIELDGKQYHDHAIDFRRDTEVLRYVDEIIRIPYAAVHFYPAATFAVLEQWHGRFALRGREIFCMPCAEFRAEIDGSVHGDGDFPTARKFVEWAEPNFELWRCDEGIGWVGSPLAYLNDWQVSPITRRFRSARDYE